MSSEYFLILPQKYIPFYTKLKNELKSSNPIEAFRNGETIRRVARHIVKRPYPVLPLVFSLENKEFQELCIHSAWGLMSSDYDKFLTFVVFSGDVTEKLPNILKTIVEKGKESSEKVLLALLAKNDRNLLTATLSSLTADKTKHQILRLALDNGEHFVLYFMHQLHICLHRSQVLDQLVKDKCVQNNLIILKVISEFSVQPTQAITDVGNLNKPIRFLTSIENELNNGQKMVLDEILRVNRALDFFKSKLTSVIIPMKNILSSNGVLGVLYEYGNITNYTFDEMKKIVEKTSKGDEQMKVLVHLFILLTTLELIVARKKKPDFYKMKINDLNIILREVKDKDFTVLMLVDIFRIIFLRWEHLQINSSKFEQVVKKNINSCSELDSYFESDLIIPKKQGFICQGKALKHLLTYLKSFVTKKSHNEVFKKCSSFATIVQTINDGLWKLSVWDIVVSNEGVSYKLPLSKKSIFQMIQTHKNLKEKSSSDDESKDRVNYASMAKRKAKLRRKSNPFGDLEDFPKNIDESKNYGNVICKMLISTEDLAEMALCVDNVQEIRNIVLKCNLKNTTIEKDIIFLENQILTQKKIEMINEKYESGDLLSSRALTQIEQIKITASKGFEASKINNVVDNFTRLNFKFPTSFDLIKKYIHHYKFLEQYSSYENLKIIPSLDLIIGSSIGYEICGNIYTLLGKDQFDRAIKTSSMGPSTFFVNLIECLRLLKSKERFGIKEILTKNYYSLNPNVCQWELKREDIFNNIFYKTNNDIGQLDCLRKLSKNFDDLKSEINYFQRFYSFISNFMKLLFLRDQNIEFHISEILKFDLKTIIGDLIFEEELTPLEIENTVSALNMNLVHVAAINICPLISKDYKGLRGHSTSQVRNQSIFNYITNQNILIGYLLQKIKNHQSQDRPFYNIKEEFLERASHLPDIKDNFEIYFNNNSLLAVLLADSVEVAEISALDNKFLALNIINSMNIKNEEIRLKRDQLIEDLVFQNPVKNLYLLESLSDVAKRGKLIMENYTKIKNFKLVKELIQSLLSNKMKGEICQEDTDNLEKVLEDIQVYSEVSDILSHPIWTQTYAFSLTSPSVILEKLLETSNYILCLKWCKVQEFYKSPNYSKQKSSFFETLFKATDQPNEVLFEIIETFPLDDVSQFYDENKEKFKSLDLVKHAVSFLYKNRTPAENKNLQNFDISIKIFECLPEVEWYQNCSLISKPLLIIEQLVMNSKFQLLNNVQKAIANLLSSNETCSYCHNQRGNMYDIHSTSRLSRFESSSAFILLNFNIYQVDHIITQECIDLVFRIYATKALDYQINESNCSSSEKMSTGNSSLDSLSGYFVMPKKPPNREDWIKDEECNTCMCCKRAVFTMLMRRHHCRRCGRVVCFACSAQRMLILDLYEDVPVRVCNDCLSQTEDLFIKMSKEKVEVGEIAAIVHENIVNKWILSGNITHDKLLRSEFCYEHAPSVGLCLSILQFHKDNAKCVHLLLYHCRQLEKLLVPNPEVDYTLVAKMMNCLALAAKVRGGPAECDKIRDHSDIILTVAQSGCEELIPSAPMNNQSLRKLNDSLVQIEKWSLALNVSLKCGFTTTGVMGAQGLSCLKAGCFETAREKFSYCMPKLSTDAINAQILKIVTMTDIQQDLRAEIDKIPRLKRPLRSPPLLEEILKIIESTLISTPQPETLARASIIRSSNSSLNSIRSKRKETVVLQEPAVNIMNTLSNLKQITKGNYTELKSRKAKIYTRKKGFSRTFEETIHYILTYGSHVDIINFFIQKNEDLSSALKYFILQNVESDIFIQHIFFKYLKIGRVPDMIEQLFEIDDSLLIWKETLIATCRYLESKSLLNSLYQLQVLLKDPVRASMTCVKFYSMNCSNFRELNSNAFHLQNANKHLQTELDLCQWENISVEKKRTHDQLSFLMQMDARTLNGHISTISKQIEVSKFLSRCEVEYCTTLQKQTAYVMKQIRTDNSKIPTLFDSSLEKIQVCMILLLCGKNIDEGSGLSFQ
ncbi:ZFYVE26 family protein [Megaselia abdita]